MNTTTFLGDKLINRRGGPPAALDDQLHALDDLRQQGKIDLIGLSNVDQTTVERALEWVDIAEIQNAYSIIDRRDDQLLAFAREREITFVPFGPLGSGYRRGPARLAADGAIARVADKHRATTTQIALAWLLASPRSLMGDGSGRGRPTRHRTAGSAHPREDGRGR
jgi:aryl-alcohol dehydrogenase-like predicted oxidoreductase